MKIAVVGGGIAGLTAAFYLSKNINHVCIFEKEASLGGLAASISDPMWDWPVEHYFHHFFSSDHEIKQILSELKIADRLKFYRPKTSIYLDGKVFQFDSPKSILLLPCLNPIDKVRIAVVSVLLKINPFFKPLENYFAYDFIKTSMGDKVFKKIWQPLLIGKFGTWANKIPASWFWTRINKRSFSLGYLDGGTEILIQSMVDMIKKNKGKIIPNSTVEKIKREKDKFELTINKNVYKDSFDKVLACIPPNLLAKIVPQLSNKEKVLAKNLKSLGSLCLILETKEKFLTDGTYWLNINDTSFPFVAVVEHTNFIDRSHYANHHILYVGGYYPTKHPFFKMDKEQILKTFLPFLKKINPLFDFKLLTLNFGLFSDIYSQPIIPPNYSKIVPSIKTSIPGLYWASLHHVYPQDRGINYAVLMGKKAANEIKNS